MRSSLWVAVAACLLIGADAPPAAAGKDDAALRGTWEVVALEINGEAVKDANFKGQTWIFSADGLAIEFKDIRATYIYKLDSSKKPKQFDLTLQVGYKLDPPNEPKLIELKPQEKNAKAEGIYSLDGDSLQVCVGHTEHPPI